MATRKSAVIDEGQRAWDYLVKLNRSRTKIMPARPIAIANRHPRLRIERRDIAQVIAVLDAHRADFLMGCPPGELSIVFLTDAALAKLHADFLADPSTTDVITFEGNHAAEIAGEICVSADTAATYATQHGRDFAEELTLYLVHGWLHLAGYDDLQPAKKRLMRRAEGRALQLLREKLGRLPRFTLGPAKPSPKPHRIPRHRA